MGWSPRNNGRLKVTTRGDIQNVEGKASGRPKLRWGIALRMTQKECEKIGDKEQQTEGIGNC